MSRRVRILCIVLAIAAAAAAAVAVWIATPLPPRLEAPLDKQRLLELYLTRVPLGQGASGVAAGAALYFDADARELSLGQAAMLGALARAPSSDNPLAAPERARARRGLTLRRLVELGF